MSPYYEEDGITIYHGDCRDVVASILPASVDLLLTDPPYGMAFASGWVQGRTVAEQAIKSDGVRQGVRVVRGALNDLVPTYAPGMHALVFCHWESWPDFYDNLCHLFSIRNALIWSKGGGGMGDLRHEYAKDYEVILFGARDRSRELNGIRTGAVIKGYKRVNSADRFVTFQKPVPLLVELIDRHCPTDGIVLDPFVGSGSTLVAAKNAGRQAIGIEIEERYCEIAVQRLAQGVLNFSTIEGAT